MQGTKRSETKPTTLWPYATETLGELVTDLANLSDGLRFINGSTNWPPNLPPHLQGLPNLLDILQQKANQLTDTANTLYYDCTQG